VLNRRVFPAPLGPQIITSEGRSTVSRVQHSRKTLRFDKLTIKTPRFALSFARCTSGISCHKCYFMALATRLNNQCAMIPGQLFFRV
jgi:hypothetical protein